MGVKNILRVHDSIGKCFENDLCKLCGCNFWRQSVADEMRLKQQLAFFYAKIAGSSLSSEPRKKDLNYVPALGCGVMQSLAVTSPDETHGFKTKGDRYNQQREKNHHARHDLKE